MVTVWLLLNSPSLESHLVMYDLVLELAAVYRLFRLWLNRSYAISQLGPFVFSENVRLRMCFPVLKSKISQRFSPAADTARRSWS